MKRPPSLPRAMAWACIFALAGTVPASALTVEELQQLLDRNGIEYDAAAARQAAVRGMLAAVDPGARWLSADELRAETAQPYFASETWTGGVLCVRIAALRPGVGVSLVALLRDWQNGADRTGIVLDLRQAAGCDLASFEALAGFFARGAPWSYRIRDRQGDRVVTRVGSSDSSDTNGWRGLPLVALIGESTSEAAEMLAVVLKDRPGVLLLGDKTRGDDRLRETLPLAGGGALRIATGRWAPVGTGKTERLVFTGTAPHLLAAASPRKASATSARDPARPKPPTGSGADPNEVEKPPADPVLRRAQDLLVALGALRGLGGGVPSSAWAPGTAKPPIAPPSGKP